MGEVNLPIDIGLYIYVIVYTLLTVIKLAP